MYKNRIKYDSLVLLTLYICTSIAEAKSRERTGWREMEETENFLQQKFIRKVYQQNF